MNNYIRQTDIILNHLRKQKSITSIEAFELYRITRLSAAIFTLRQQYNIVGIRETNPETETKFCRYVLLKRKK